MAEIEIHRATADQAGTLTALMHASSAYRGEYASILDGYTIAPHYIETNPTYTATRSGEILGFYALLDAELDLLFVADQAQGLGIGARLIEHMLAGARERGLDSVRVVSHPPALAFYVRMGARRTGTIPAKPPKIRWDRPELRFDVPTC
ncbi:acetyltransferase [Amycolatopsis mediterranei S699]|uniref:Acetyltransferase n=2 Tax=Amycolatopsis mediterranei TaxID=33910 RepID=A0A9R0P3I0_AMYMS|nr:GNAT family N-acetyltransferase [Amycolatopsis mediterranei]ADJ48652.1 putative acetyltransferase [Amycolatopsis mediterranei U32]AEK45587.1 acetyltransferase [Amycolatopsis mediterranei S699]AFO80362.1 acetyltransferase [Amycolatopsis mediterranei S699]AGT87490.1 acetyltransferase [Amycolatopsis mediterranei RB]KDO03868.1 acetyltransferase [Amycolatopsis mediterranei]